ncbi:MAG: FecR domain-containing protein [Planctomycetota bacterium]
MPDDRVASLMKGFFAGEAAPEVVEAIDEWVREDRANARLLAEFVMLDGLLLVDQKNIDAASILTTLQDTKQDAAPLSLDDLIATSGQDPRAQRPDSDALSFGELSSLGVYLLNKALKSKPAIVAYAAAVVLLCTVGILIWGNDAPDPVATQPDNIIEPGPIGPISPGTNPIVATLTAERDAVWDRRPGQDLYAGQRFTLDEGSVQITTRTGAVIELQAPSTFGVQGINNVWISEGRLIASCATSASKGFTVDTPNARIVDYGTDFSVQAGTDGRTRVQVLEGEVKVATRRGGAVIGETVSLGAQQAAIVYAGQKSVVRVAFEADVFERRLVRRLDVVDMVAGGDGFGEREGIGIDLADGRFVSNKTMSEKTIEDWQVVAGGALAVQESKVIDSVFVISRLTGRSALSTRGDFFAGFPAMQEEQRDLPDTSNHGFGFIQANRIDSIVQPSDDSASISGTYTSGDWPRLSGRAFVIHSGAGLTIDLHAIGHTNTQQATGRFTANVLNVEALNRTKLNPKELATADIWVIVDGEPRLARRSIRTKDGVIKVDVELKAGDRFLTLAVSQGGDGRISHDWVVWEQPQIELWQERSK